MEGMTYSFQINFQLLRLLDFCLKFVRKHFFMAILLFYTCTVKMSANKLNIDYRFMIVLTD